MIYSLSGVVQHKGISTAVVDVHGVGMLVHTTPRALSAMRLGEATTLHTVLIVREDSLTLFGFDAAWDQEVFETVISVNGIGPKLGLAMLALYTAEQIRRAVADGDHKALAKVPGIGPKTAQRIILELAGKLQPGPGSSPATSNATPAVVDQVVAALTTLGWSAKESDQAVAATLEAEPELSGAAVDKVLRRTLAQLGQQNTRR